ncbi:copper-binding protein [Rhodoblastus sp.]|jgi:Cu/Ag efflux protein CusF|uniref:copper-binding protein n=1 Tax=Rhodoblastus sp. TaxID=1962975 RepID=UPI0025F58E8A|nr:copper-binding protein [Rhodoblastus sp.]
MLKSKSRIALALVLALTSAAPAFAMGRMGGPEWLSMMEKIRADKAAPGTPLWVLVRVKNADVPGHKLTISHRAIPQIHMPAMTMTFPVVDPTHLKMLHKGDPVDIEVANENGEVKIIDFRMEH